MYDMRDLERRRTERRQVDAAGTLRFNADLKVVNIGPRGIETETSERLMVGSDYDVLIHLDDENVTVRGTVVWSKLDRTVHTRSGDVRPVYRSGLEAASASIPILERLVDRESIPSLQS
jgi:hypothetical protein